MKEPWCMFYRDCKRLRDSNREPHCSWIECSQNRPIIKPKYKKRMIRKEVI